MRTKTTLLLGFLALGGSIGSAYADQITWQLNGTGAGGGISYDDGSVVTGTVIYDTTAGNFITAGNTISVTDGAYPGSPSVGIPPAGCPNPTANGCTGVMAPGSTWYVDTAVSNSSELLMVNVAPDAGVDNLQGASYFSMFATGAFDGSDGLPPNTGQGNPAGTYTEMLYDAFNGGLGPTYAGTCFAADCSTSDIGNYLTAALSSNQGTTAALNESTCIANSEGCDPGNPGAYFSTVIPAGPPNGPSSGTPEPSTFVLLGGALIAFGGTRLRKASSK